MKIGYVMQNGAPDLNTPSGPQIHVMQVIKGLIHLGNEVRIIALQDQHLLVSDDFETWDQINFDRFRFKGLSLFESFIRRVQSEFHLPYLNLFDSFHFAHVCADKLKNFDILYERHDYLGYGGLIASRKLGVPLVLELNGNILKEIDMMGLKMSRFQRLIGRLITVMTFNLASHIVVVSHALRDMLYEGTKIKKQRISVIINGVDVNIFSQTFDEQKIRNHNQIFGKPLITFVGSFQPWHGIDLLVHSFKLVLQRFPCAELLILGDGRLREEIFHLITEENLNERIYLPGILPQDQVAALLSISDVLTAPYPFTHQEIVGTPLKLLEYMASGRPIVASSASIHEIIHDGVTGLRVQPGDPNALAQGIINLVEDKRLASRLGHNARDEVHKKYTWDKTVGCLNTLLHSQVRNKN